MNLSHYFYLYPAYAVALIGWMVTNKYAKFNSNGRETYDYKLDKPWLEFIFALLAAVVTLLIGQLYMRGDLLPSSLRFPYLVDAVNQLLIFSPFFLLLIIRKQPLTTAWIPKKNKFISLGIGIILAVLALITFMLLKGKTHIFEDILNIYHYKNLSKLVQVFAEDFAISACLFRLMQWIGQKKAIVLIAILFAAGHIPAMISNGIALQNFSSLLLDTFLAIVVLYTLSKSRNFLWFWMVHYTLDMTQFIN